MQIRIIKPISFVQFGLLVMILKVSCNLSNILPYTDTMDKLLSFLAVALLGIEILHQKYTKKKIYLYVALTLLSGISVLLTGNYGFVISIITCMAISQIELKRVIRFIYQYELLFYTFHCVLSLFMWLLGRGAIYQVIRNEIRFTFGFVHPNTLAIYGFNLICMWLWLNYESMTKKKIYEILVISSVLYFLSKTRTTFILTLMLVVLLLFATSKKERRYLTMIACYIVPIAYVSSIVLVEMYLRGNGIAYWFDKILTGRVKLGAYASYHMDITLLGQGIERLQNIRWDSKWMLNAFTFDNVYTCLTYNQGLIWIIAFSVAFYLLAKRGGKKECIFIILWAAYGVTEVNGLNVFLFFPLLMVSRLLGREREKTEV